MVFRLRKGRLFGRRHINRHLKENVYWALDGCPKLCQDNIHALTHLILITDKAGIVKPVHAKGSQSWIFTGRTDDEAAAPIFGLLRQRANSLEKTLILGKIKGKSKGGDWEWDGCMASPTQWIWVEQTPGGSEGQGSLVCCHAWDHKESDTTERLNKKTHV